MSQFGDNVLTQGLVTLMNGVTNNISNNKELAKDTMDDNNELVFTSFNQDTTSLAVGTTSGYKLYSLTTTDTLDPIYTNATEDVYIAERLFSSSLVAIVTQSAPRKLKVCHFKKGTEICNYSYTSKILAVKMNRARLVVCLEESLFIHNIRDMKVLHTIRETPPNKNGLCALSTDSDHCYLAYPGHSSVGELQIFDALHLASKAMIPAHAGQLAAIQFSPLGNRVATASDKGTVIRIFNVSDGSKVYELRRGLKRTATIYSLSFSPCGHFLACSSNTETIHIFRLDDKPKERSNEAESKTPPSGQSSDSWMGYLGNVVSASANYLPSQVTDTLLQERAFATVHHNLYGKRNICALAMIKKVLRLLLTSEDGYLYVYSLDVNDGGDCALIRQFHLNKDHPASEVLGAQGGTPEAVRLEQQQLESASEVDSTTTDNKPSLAACSDFEISYADRTKNRHPTDMTDSEKFHEMAAATESPPKQCFLLDDDGEFPPMNKANNNKD
jgi:autophagy-related protein 18